MIITLEKILQNATIYAFCNYMHLLIIYNYNKSFLQKKIMFLPLVIFITWDAINGTNPFNQMNCTGDFPSTQLIINHISCKYNLEYW